jgi:hypothetical protein
VCRCVYVFTLSLHAVCAYAPPLSPGPAHFSDMLHTQTHRHTHPPTPQPTPPHT